MRQRPILVAAAVAAMAAALAGSRAQAQAGMAFQPVAPCRLWDTRFPPPTPPVPHGANTTRDFVVRGRCGVPATAQAVAINVTVTQATDLGNLRIYPTALPSPPTASLLNWAAGETVANGGIVRLGSDAAGNHVRVQIDMPPQSTGTVHSLADVTGYFQ